MESPTLIANVSKDHVAVGPKVLYVILLRFYESKLNHVAIIIFTVLIRLQADLGYKPRPQTSHAKN